MEATEIEMINRLTPTHDELRHLLFQHRNFEKDLSRLESIQHEGATPRKHVIAGEQIGTSGVGNGVMHLHIGLLLDGNVEQDTWASLLVEGDVRKVMGGYRNGESLPAQ